MTSSATSMNPSDQRLRRSICASAEVVVHASDHDCIRQKRHALLSFTGSGYGLAAHDRASWFAVERGLRSTTSAVMPFRHARSCVSTAVELPSASFRRCTGAEVGIPNGVVPKTATAFSVDTTVCSLQPSSPIAASRGDVCECIGRLLTRAVMLRTRAFDALRSR